MNSKQADEGSIWPETYAVTANDPRLARGWLWPACFLLFLMIVLPMVRSLVYVKTALFAFLLVLVVIQGIRGVHLYKGVVAWTVALSALSVIFGLRGLVLSAPGARQSIEVYALWPLVYLALLSGIRSVAPFQSLEKTIIFSTMFIALFLAVLIPSELHLIPEVPGVRLLFSESELESGNYLGVYLQEGHVVIGFPGLYSCFFLVSFVMAAWIDRWRNSTRVWAGKRLLTVAMFLSLPLVILSGRRALQLVALITPFITLALGLFAPKTERLRLTKSFFLTMILAVSILGLSFWFLSSAQLVTAQGLSDRFSTGFDFSVSNRSDSAVGRIDQYLVLMDGWKEHPWIGNGLGAAAHRSVRSNDEPWSYELSYVDLLFQTGLLGMLAYLSGIAWIYWSGIKIIRSGGEGCRLMLPLLVGLTSLLIANGTNPYLARFDGIWVIFLPLAFVNHWLLTRSKKPGVLKLNSWVDV